MSTPDFACCATISSTPRAMAASNFAASYDSPRSCANRKSTTSCERGRLPTCDVRIRSELRCICSPDLVEWGGASAAPFPPGLKPRPTRLCGDGGAGLQFRPHLPGTFDHRLQFRERDF